MNLPFYENCPCRPSMNSSVNDNITLEVDIALTRKLYGMALIRSGFIAQCLFDED